jgi:hypothetical protein
MEKARMLIFVRRHDRWRLNYRIEVNLALHGLIDRNVRRDFHGLTPGFRAILRTEN